VNGRADSREPSGDALFSVVLVHPAIAPNTGNVIRLCANTGARLHLVEPLGFAIDSARMRRAGLDYHEFASMKLHRSWQHFIDAEQPARMFALTTRAVRRPDQTAFAAGDYFVFGAETSGLPDSVRQQFADEYCLRIPMRPNNRSLNLSNAVAIVVYEAWRQHGYAGAAPT
jgi:tRNA (cytidine/uridine-2'-O-)-methyltransferase